MRGVVITDLASFVPQRDPYISMAEGAALMRAVTKSSAWNSQRFLRLLQSKAPEALELHKRPGCGKGRYYVTKDGLRAAFREVWDRLLLEQAEVNEDGWGE